LGVQNKLMMVMKGLNKIEPSQMEFGRTKYSYLSENAMTPAVKELFEANGLTISPDTAEYSNMVVGDSILSTVTIGYTITDVDSGEKINAVGVGQGMDRGDKAIPKACTAALKQMFRHLLLIASPERLDPDNTASDALRGSSTPSTPTYNNDDPGSAILKFGPHAGKSLRWLLENDKPALVKMSEGSGKFADIATKLLKE
jgi:hypothetical protein